MTGFAYQKGGMLYFFFGIWPGRKKMKYIQRKLVQTDSKSLLYHFYAISIFFCYLASLVTAYALISDDFADHCWSNKPYEKLRNINKKTRAKKRYFKTKVNSSKGPFSYYVRVKGWVGGIAEYLLFLTGVGGWFWITLT